MWVSGRLGWADVARRVATAGEEDSPPYAGQPVPVGVGFGGLGDALKEPREVS
jgi:hypothetical protein